METTPDSTARLMMDSSKGPRNMAGKRVRISMRMLIPFCPTSGGTTNWEQGARATTADARMLRRAAEHRHRRLLKPLGAHGFREAGDFVVDDCPCGLGCHVARAEAGAACRHDQVEPPTVCPLS